jgi:hypothetical protein
VVLVQGNYRNSPTVGMMTNNLGDQTVAIADRLNHRARLSKACQTFLIRFSEIPRLFRL